MNTKLLKQKILDLAIRGKLTQQLKSDGTARDLLTQISDERRKTRDERKGTRSKKSGVILSEAQSAKSKDLGQIIPLDKSEAPFEIPANWEWVRLGDVGKWQSGTTPSKSNSAYYKDGTIPWLNTGDLNDGIINDIPKRVTEKALAETSLRLNEAGSVCIAMYGATIGKLGILSMPATTNQACCVCNNLKSFVNRMWLFYFLMNHKQEFIEAGFGGAQPNISKEKIVSTIFPLPPLAEQQRIVEKIQEAFTETDSIENNKELLKTHIKQTRQKILDLAIHGKLVPQNKSDEPASVLLERITRDNPHYEKLTDIPFEIPESWEWIKLGDVAALKGGKRVPAGKTMTTEPTSHIYIRVTDMRDGTIYDDDLHYITDEIYEVIKNYTISKKDLYITIAGTIGRVGLVPDFFDGMNLTENALKVTEITIEKKYLMFVLQSRFVQEYFESTYHQVAMPKLSLVNASKAVIPLPPLAEQKRIVDRIEEIFASLDDNSLHLV